MMQKLLTLAVLCLSALSFNVALAHGGAKARHGGVVATASDLSFELAAQGSNAVIYIEDHGKPMAPTGLKGKLTMLSGTVKSEAELVVAGDKLEAKGITLAPGAKVVAIADNEALGRTRQSHQRGLQAEA